MTKQIIKDCGILNLKQCTIAYDKLTISKDGLQRSEQLGYWLGARIKSLNLETLLAIMLIITPIIKEHLNEIC